MTSTTKVDDVRGLADLSKEEERRVKDLRDRLRDLQAANPKQRAGELRLKAERIDLVVGHITKLADVLGETGLATVRSATDSLRIAREALAFLRKTALTSDLLPGSGEDAWRRMWDAAGAFSGIAYPGPRSVLRDRAKELQGQRLILEPEAAAELNELEARASLKTQLQPVVDEIERQKRVAAYKQCLEDTQTQPITRKSTELTKRLVTDQLRKTFPQELSKLEFNHLAVEIQAAGGSKGALFHRLAFSNAPGVVVTDVLSEGESRTLSLAAFLTELSTASSDSGIIFDDPVSSLDEFWRERIAHRLVGETKKRQVIVFTHSMFFLRSLMDECRRQGVSCHHQYVRRNGQAGISSSDLPWIAMGVKDRLGRLRELWQAAERVFRASGSSAYERDAREIYALTRETWEQAVSEVLLNDVVEPYRTTIETKKVNKLHDISKDEYGMLEEGMAKCSR